MLLAGENGMWNVGTGEATTINQLLGAAEGVYGPAVSVERAPARAGDVFSSCLAVDKIARDLGWRPALSLSAGLRTLDPARARPVAGDT
jgi:UDP-glucose 4-epimerase